MALLLDTSGMVVSPVTEKRLIHRILEGLLNQHNRPERLQLLICRVQSGTPQSQEFYPLFILRFNDSRMRIGNGVRDGRGGRAIIDSFLIKMGYYIFFAQFFLWTKPHFFRVGKKYRVEITWIPFGLLFFLSFVLRLKRPQC